MKRLLIPLTFGLCLFVGMDALQAAELFEYDRPSRAMGMGGVYLPFVTDADATIWNPAVLADTKSITWEVMNLGLGVNGKDALELAEMVQDSNCSGTSCYSDMYGVPLWLGYHAGTKLAMPRAGFSLFGSGFLSGSLHNPAFPNLHLTYFSDIIYTASYGFPIRENLNGGITLKRIQRTGGTEDISLSTVSSGGDSILEEFNRKGSGLGLDLGLQWKLPGIPQTIVALQWQDVGVTEFQSTTSAGAPDRTLDNLSLGVGSEFDLPGLDLRAGIEYRHITKKREELGKKLHVGGEVSLPFIDVRAGLNQGYPTIGAGVDFFLFRLDVASYTEEMGVYPGQSPSHRYKMDLSMSLSVDADFGFSATSADGKKRRLKQRR